MRCPHCQESVDLVDAHFCASCGKALPTGEDDPLVGQMVGGRYKVVSLIAEGGMGRVYLAEQDMGGASRRVAIKVLLSQYSVRKADVTRFMRECSTVSQLEHPNTIKFYDYGQTDDGDLYIAMEYVRGRSLARELIEVGTLPPERLDLIVGQICGSLQEAHDKGIIHRDLKPDNIILTDAAGQGDFVKVLDFGIAKRMDERDVKLTPLGVVLGSPPYMSPEQFTLQDVDSRSDIYSLGVLVYQALTGQMPFEAQEMLHWATLHMTEAPTPFETTDIGMLAPGPMRRAVLRALAKEAQQRPQSMREFYAEFTMHERKSLPAGRASVVPQAFLGDHAAPPFPPGERAPEERDARGAKTMMDESLSSPPQGGLGSAPIPLVPRPGKIPAEMAAQPTRAASDIDPDATWKMDELRRGARLTVPELVPPTVRDPSLIHAPPSGSGRAVLWVVLGALVVALGIVGAWLIARGMAKEPARAPRDPRPVPTVVVAPPSPLESGAAPWPPAEATPRPAASTPAPVIDDSTSPCQTAMVGALSAKCDLARRALLRCPEGSAHRASAVRAVDALCGPTP